MRYLVIVPGHCEPFLLNLFDIDNIFKSELGMVVFDLINQTYTDDGKTWKEIEFYFL